MRQPKEEFAAKVLIACVAFAALLLFVFLTTSCKTGYRAVEPVMPNQPRELPPSYRTPLGAIVHSDTEPSAQALSLIDSGIMEAVAAAFRDNPKFTPADAWKNWRDYKTPREYRFFLIDTEERSIMPETEGCPILKSYYGYVAGITSGFQIVNAKIEARFPLTQMPKLTDTRPHCVELFRKTAKHEAEHWITANDTTVFLDLFQYDVHPYFD